MRLLPFISLLVLTIIAGCGGNNNTEKIARIDSLYQSLTVIEEKFNSLNIDTVKMKYEWYKLNSEYLKDNFYDLKNDSTWPYLCTYNNVRKPFKDFVFNYQYLKSEIDTAKRQLENMKHDLSNGAMNEAEFTANFYLEFQAATELNVKIRNTVTSVQSQLQNFDTVHPVIVKIITDHMNSAKKEKDKNAGN